MSRVDYSWRIEGVGFDDTQSRAADFSYRVDPSHGEPSLAERPTPKTIRAHPIKHDLELPSRTATFRYGKLDPDADPQMATEFFERDLTGTALVTARFSDTTTVVPIAQPGLDNSVVHIDHEAIKLGSFDSTAEEYTGCNRDVWSIATGIGATPHEAGTQVYTDQPYWHGRLAALVEERDDSSSVVGTYIIEEVATAKNGAALKCELRNLFSVLLDQSIGGGKPIRQHEPCSLSVTNSGVLVIDFSSMDSTVRKVGSSSDLSGYALHVDDSIFLVSRGARYSVPLLDGPLIEQGEDMDGDTKIADLEADAYEVAAFGRQVKNEYLSYASTPTMIPTEGQTTYEHHPVNIFLAHATSQRYTQSDGPPVDVMQGDYGLGLTSQLSESVVSQHRDHAVDHYFTGLGGDSKPVSDLIALLYRWGYAMVPKSDGTAEVKRWGAPTVESLDAASDASALAGTLRLEAGYDDQITEVKMLVGDALPHRDPKEITQTISDRPQPDFVSGRQMEMSLPEVSANREDFLVGRVTAESQFLKYGYETTTIRVLHEDAVSGVSSWELLDWVAIVDMPTEERWKVVDGSRAVADGSFDWLGQIVGLTRAASYVELELIMPRTKLVRWRGPAMEIVDDTHTTDDDFVECETTTQFAFTDIDCTAFKVGDEIAIYSRDLSKRKGPFEISDVQTSGSNPGLTISGTFGLGSMVGDIVRIADYDNYDNPSAHLTGVDYPWVFLADSASTLGSASDDAHSYGE